MSAPAVIFIFDLIQDVGILRPIVRTIGFERGFPIHLLYSAQFAKRDKTGDWCKEIEQLGQAVSARISSYEDVFEASQLMQGLSGILFSASESNLPAHRLNHDIFQAAPPGITRVTVQHGFECVGFNQNREQSMAHGKSVRFGADIICGWTPPHLMRHIAPSERDKYFHLGPPSLLNRLYEHLRSSTPERIGLVCENLHSVRMRIAGAFQAPYLGTIVSFAEREAAKNLKIALRPHPGGQYLLRNNIDLPSNVVIANAPMYRTALSDFTFGISAPSSVLVDMVMADIPTAVWCDENSIIDTSGYAGLHHVSSLADWIEFADRARENPAPFISLQHDFLERNGLSIEPTQVRERLLRLVDGVCSVGQPRQVAARPKRVLFVANGVIPTLHISFLKPLAALEEQGTITLKIVTEKDISRRTAADPSDESAARWVRDEIASFRPDIAVFCRYSGPMAVQMIAQLRAAKVPIVFHIDDDLLNVPRELGEKKFLEHNRTERTSTVRLLLEQADLVYCSTRRLRTALSGFDTGDRLQHGEIYATSDVVAAASAGPTRKIGFMGNDKTVELTMLIPVLIDILTKYPQIEFEMFGSVAMPEALRQFGDRVSATPAISDYDKFVEAFTALRWDIGLCPLMPTPFNVVKANTKWIDYTSIGAAVIASRSTAYDDCCSGDCGALVEGPHEWFDAIEAMILNPGARFETVTNAQRKLRAQYRLDQLRAQVLAMFDTATERHERRSAAVIDAVPTPDMMGDDPEADRDFGDFRRGRFNEQSRG